MTRRQYQPKPRDIIDFSGALRFHQLVPTPADPSVPTILLRVAFGTGVSQWMRPAGSLHDLRKRCEPVNRERRRNSRLLFSKRLICVMGTVHLRLVEKRRNAHTWKQDTQRLMMR